jgi:hypothetical protein
VWGSEIVETLGNRLTRRTDMNCTVLLQRNGALSEVRADMLQAGPENVGRLQLRPGTRSQGNVRRRKPLRSEALRRCFYSRRKS